MAAEAITDEDVLKLLRSQVKQRRDSVEQYQKGRTAGIG